MRAIITSLMHLGIVFSRSQEIYFQKRKKKYLKHNLATEKMAVTEDCLKIISVRIIIRVFLKNTFSKKN